MLRPKNVWKQGMETGVWKWVWKRDVQREPCWRHCRHLSLRAWPHRSPTHLRRPKRLQTCTWRVLGQIGMEMGMEKVWKWVWKWHRDGLGETRIWHHQGLQCHGLALVWSGRKRLCLVHRFEDFHLQVALRMPLGITNSVEQAWKISSIHLPLRRCVVCLHLL